jgi:hypothetical protein
MLAKTPLILKLAWRSIAMWRYALLILLILYGCGDATLPPNPPEEEIAVYNTLLALEASSDAHSGLYHVTSMGGAPCHPSYIQGRVADVSAQIIDQFCQRNSRGQPFSPAVLQQLKSPWPLVSSNPLGTLNRLSAIQFNPTFTEALVHTSYSGPELSGGSYFWLVKKDGVWSIQHSAAGQACARCIN